VARCTEVNLEGGIDAMTSTRKLTLGTGLVASLLAALALATWSTATAAPSKLRGSVGPSETISLKTANGKKVSMVSRGTYAITVRDNSDEHNFVISGPGLKKQITSIGFVGTKTVTVKLRPGTYRFVCIPHADDMSGGFRVR
jgi:plastocyanin